MKFIRIGKPHIEHMQTDHARLVFDLHASDKEEIYPLYYEVNKSYEQYLVTELSDAAVVCLLLYAMEYGYDLICESPISERLQHQLTEFLIPAIAKNVSRYSAIQIHAEGVNIDFAPTAVGTGLSCGVDSFYTVYKGLAHPVGSPLCLTHVCFFNAGALGMYGGEDARRKYLESCEKFSKVANKLGLEFLSCDSNMNEYLHQDHMATHVFRTLSIPLALQKLFSVYYLASGFSYEKFGFSVNSPAKYEILILPLLSNQNLRFQEVGGETTRQGKVVYIADFPVPKEHLTVCIGESQNCTHCRKCKRTMLNLYLIDKLRDYDQVFDVEWFYKHRKKVIRWAMLDYWRADMGEIIAALRRKHDINIFDYLMVAIMFPFHMAKGFIGKVKFKRKNHAKW